MMEDLISRQAAIDAFYIQSDDDGWWTGTAEDMENLLKALPSAPPDIVKCKDCAKREYCRTSTIWAVAPDDDWYCADAERRTE